jgi:GAF domain-containing protein
MERQEQKTLVALRAELARLRQEAAERQNELARLHERQREQEARLAEQETRLAEQQAAHRRSLERITLAEEQATRLTRLYVSTLRLHEARAPEQVLEALQEIAANLIGSEELALFRLEPGSHTLVKRCSLGLPAEHLRTVELGQGPIGQAALSGETYVAPVPPRVGQGAPEQVSACVPLRLEGRMYGALALFHLLPQKQRLDDTDRELLELLAEHAAPALYRAELYALHPVAES